MTFPERLRNEMKRAGLTPLGLADRCGVTFMTVDNWLNGRHMPNAEAIVRLRIVLDCTFDDLLGLGIEQ